MTTPGQNAAAKFAKNEVPCAIITHVIAFCMLLV